MCCCLFFPTFFFFFYFGGGGSQVFFWFSSFFVFSFFFLNMFCLLVLDQVQLTWLTHETTASLKTRKKRTTRVPCSAKNRGLLPKQKECYFPFGFPFKPSKKGMVVVEDTHFEVNLEGIHMKTSPACALRKHKLHIAFGGRP